MQLFYKLRDGLPPEIGQRRFIEQIQVGDR
jgi:hypothetical protein